MDAFSWSGTYTGTNLPLPNRVAVMCLTPFGKYSARIPAGHRFGYPNSSRRLLSCEAI